MVYKGKKIILYTIYITNSLYFLKNKKINLLTTKYLTTSE